MKNEIYKKKWWKRVVPMMCALVVMFVSVVPVNASALGGVQIEQGSFLEGTMSFTRSDVDYVGAFQLEVVKSSAPIYVFFYSYTSSSNDLGRGACLVSEKSFSTKSYYSEFRNGNDIVFDILQDRNSASTSYNGKTYYFDTLSSLGGNPAVFEFHEFSIPYVNIDEYGQLFNGLQWGQIFEKFYNADLIFQGGKTDISFDLINSGNFSKSLGYLENCRVKTLIGTESSQMTKTVLWDNTHEEWDDSYRVAHFVKFYGVVAGMTTQEFYSDMYLMNEVPYSDCQSTYDYGGDAYQSASEEFRTFLESKKTLLNNQITFGADQWLIIYRETDDGVQYGYWNQLKTATDTGACPEHNYGLFDSDGEYTEVEDLGDIDAEIGRGDDLEDAEQNKETITPETDFDNAGSLNDSMTNIFTDFFNALKSAFSFVGEFPQYISEFFSFLPAGIIGCISLGILMVIILRFLGR